MSYDDVDQTPEPVLSLGDAALLSVFAKLFKDHVVPAIDEKIAAVKSPLLAAYDDPESSTKSIDAKVNGVAVATHTVAISKDKYVVDDEEAFNAFAEEHDEVEVIIQARPAFRDKMLKLAKYDKATGAIVDKSTGEVIPGITRIPGGKPTGSVSLRWKEGGQEAVLEAFHKGELDSLLRGVPMLPAAPDRSPMQQ
ncbi:hypothetical protein [Streptomyces noursei]|uniref:hypothetical protein n=1 Tax=Streptomyces noursei TaxID=1971 RepID=UPI001673C6A5|nr:hypothetical protein [Streptomyces noursei]MCZ1014486.1 hypothetical protein [Streptomyces noursei]GGW95384.1 hypothetical protein GCM10010341_15760 [Streptomyces noursei]